MAYLICGHPDYHGPNPPILVHVEGDYYVLVNATTARRGLRAGATMLTFDTEAVADVFMEDCPFRFQLVEVTLTRDAQQRVTDFAFVAPVRSLDPGRTIPPESNGTSGGSR